MLRKFVNNVADFINMHTEVIITILLIAFGAMAGWFATLLWTSNGTSRNTAVLTQDNIMEVLGEELTDSELSVIKEEFSSVGSAVVEIPAWNNDGDMVDITGETKQGDREFPFRFRLRFSKVARKWYLDCWTWGGRFICPNPDCIYYIGSVDD